MNLSKEVQTMKHKLLTIITGAGLFLFMTTAAFAETGTTTVETEYFPDGSYAVITTNIEPVSATTFATETTKSANRTYTYYASDNSKEWTFTLTGTFTYNGTTAKATKAETSYNIYVSGWKCIYKHGSVSGAVAAGQGTFQYKSGLTKNVSLSLKCSPTGSISSI